VPTEDRPANDNIWSRGKDILTLKIPGNPSHIWLMHGSFFEHTNWADLRIFLWSHPSNHPRLQVTLLLVRHPPPPPNSACFISELLRQFLVLPAVRQPLPKDAYFDTRLDSLRRGEPLTLARISARIPLESSSPLKGRRTNAATHARPRTKRRVVSDEESITSPTTPPSFSTFGCQLRPDFQHYPIGVIPRVYRPLVFNHHPNAPWT